MFQHESQLKNLLNRVCRAFDNVEFIISLFMDLNKAFDLVNGSILLRKLYLHGIRDIEND